MSRILSVILTSTRRPMLAMWGEDSPTVSSFSVCEKIKQTGFTDDYKKMTTTDGHLVTSGHLFGSTPYLSCEAATQVHGTGASLGCLEPQHDGGGEFIVSSTTAGLLLLAQHTHNKQ